MTVIVYHRKRVNAMKNIKIMQLRLENFKCHRLLELDLQGRSASIYGDNAAGKTSIYDALTWLLFGKDSAGNGEKNIDVKPLDSTGNTDRHTITAVEAVLQVAGEIITLRRTYRELWSSKRGSSAETYDGNTSEYYVDGVPCKKAAFDSRIQEIVPEETFRLLTSVSYFAQDLHWQKRRAVLFDTAGVMTDMQLMVMDSRFSALSQAIGNLSLEDYRRKLMSEKKNLTGVKTDIPARISECQKIVVDLEKIDYDTIRSEVDLLEQEAATVAAQLNNPGTNERGQQEKELSQLELLLVQKESQLRFYESTLASYIRSIDEARTRWVSVNQETFCGGTCPTCGRELPGDQLISAQSAFEQSKNRRLLEIEQMATSQKTAMEQTQGQLEQLRNEMQQDRERAEGLRKALTVAAVNSTGYAKEKLTDLRRVLADKRAELGKYHALEMARKRIAELQQDAREAAEKLETVEEMLFAVEEFTRYKTRFVEDSINNMFRVARFRLFRDQANGGIEERCDVVCDGVPYMGLNNGAKINAGIDIINTLSHRFGVAVPLFVDNAESVTKLERAATQTIRLVVSAADKELRCVYED